MTLPTIKRSTWIVIAACAALSLPAIASAQVCVSDLTEVEIDLDTDLLKDEIRRRPKDIDIADTVRVFTNSGGARTRVGCVAYNRSGTPIGRTRVFIPGNGMKFMRASDLSNSQDFVGHVACSTQGHIIPSALFLGPEIVNLNVRSTGHDGAVRIRFPVVATY
jgi:hypothetical protein